MNQSLLEYSNISNILISKEPFPDSAAKGYYKPPTHSITLNTENTETENVHTLIHELAHAEMHNNNKLKNTELTMQAAPVLEYQAEMTAYVVGKYYGLDTEKHSLRYISNWTNNLEKVEDKINSLSEVKKPSEKLIDQIGLIVEQTTERKQGMNPNKDVSTSSRNRQFLLISFLHFLLNKFLHFLIEIHSLYFSFCSFRHSFVSLQHGGEDDLGLQSQSFIA